jgi:hypothetical protein
MKGTGMDVNLGEEFVGARTLFREASTERD